MKDSPFCCLWMSNKQTHKQTNKTPTRPFHNFKTHNMSRFSQTRLAWKSLQQQEKRKVSTLCETLPCPRTWLSTIDEFCMLWSPLATHTKVWIKMAVWTATQCGWLSKQPFVPYFMRRQGWPKHAKLVYSGKVMTPPPPPCISLLPKYFLLSYALSGTERRGRDCFCISLLPK